MRTARYVWERERVREREREREPVNALLQPCEKSCQVLRPCVKCMLNGSCSINCSHISYVNRTGVVGAFHEEGKDAHDGCGREGK